MSDSDEDDFSYFGTPLQELEEDELHTHKAPRIEDQVVLDKQGRRRFHGAFTGGFSAGYFNSVGTKEGWTPSAFVSSRSQRTKSKQARPQDFMDEEDMAVHGISPQGIQASSSFDDSEPKKRKRVEDPTGPIPGIPVLEEILKPSRETVGMKLLRHFGWRPGQGIGPRISRYQKIAARKEKRKKHGLLEIEDSSSDNEEDEAHLQDVTFAPDDVDTLSLTRAKVDHFGLGYKPLDRTPVLGGHTNLFDPSPLAMTEKKKKLLIKGQAFGVGAFEDEDEDVQVYATEDMSDYDFGEEKKFSEMTGGERKDQQPMVSLGLLEVLKGFSICSKPQHHHKVYPLPTIPQDFVPHHQPHRRRFEYKESELRGLGRHNMTAEQRAKSIAEQPKTTVEVICGIKGDTHQLSKDKSKPVDAVAVDQIYEEFKSREEVLGSEFKPFAKDTEKQRRYDLYLKMKEKDQKDRFYLVQPKSMTEWEREREVQEFNKAAHLFKPLTSTMANRFVSAVTTDSDPNLKDGLNVNIRKAEPVKSDSILDLLGTNVADERMKAAKMNMFGKLTQSSEEWHPDRLLCRRFNIPNPYPESSHVGTYKAKREKFTIFNFLTAPKKNTAGLKEASSLSEEVKTNDGNLDEKPEPETFGLKVSVDGPPTMDLFKAIFQDSDSESESNSDSENEETTGTKSTSKEEKEESSDKDTKPQELDSDVTSTAVTATVDTLKVISTTDTTKDSQANNSPDQQKVRISRFEPKEENSTSRYASLPKPVFIQRKKETTTPEAASSKGIFANIDFEELNSYRQTSMTVSPDQISTIDKVEECNSQRSQVVSDSSVDSEDEYGPPIPTHLKNRIQMIRSPPPAKSAIIENLQEKQDTSIKKDSQWVEKETEIKSSKKHRHKNKNKMKKKKKKYKKHKERKHKKKELKSPRRKNSSSSNTDLSDSD